MTLDDLEALAKAVQDPCADGWVTVNGRAETHHNVILDLIRRVREAERAKASFRVAVTNELAFAGHEIERLRAERDTALARLAEVERERDALRAQLRDAAECVDRAESSAERHLDNKRWWMAGMAVVHFFDLAREDAVRLALRVPPSNHDTTRFAEFVSQGLYQSRARCADLEQREQRRRWIAAEAKVEGACEMVRHYRPRIRALNRRAQQAESRATKAERANATLQARLDGALAKLASERKSIPHARATFAPGLRTGMLVQYYDAANATRLGRITGFTEPCYVAVQTIPGGAEIQLHHERVMEAVCHEFGDHGPCVVCDEPSERPADGPCPCGAWHRPDEGHAAPGEGGRMMDEDTKRLARDVARLTRQRNEYAEVFVAMTARAEAAEAKLSELREDLARMVSLYERACDAQVTAERERDEARAERDAWRAKAEARPEITPQEAATFFAYDNMEWISAEERDEMTATMDRIHDALRAHASKAVG